MKNNKKDLKGQRFGKLIVMEETDKRLDGGSIVWKCKCDCGNVVEISSKRLRTEMNVSCGCYQKERQKYSMSKLHDRQFIDNTNIDLISRKQANSNSKSGVRGVHWCESKKKWIATLVFQKKIVLNESFKENELDKAIQTRKEAEEKYFKPILKKHKKTELYRKSLSFLKQQDKKISKNEWNKIAKENNLLSAKSIEYISQKKFKEILIAD